MKKISLLAVLLITLSSCMWGQGAHRLNQVISRGNGVAANVVPNAKIKVCVVGTNCVTEAVIYNDAGLTSRALNPVTADTAGNYGYYVSGCVDEQISSPGQGNLFLQNVCPFNGTGGGGSPASPANSTQINLGGSFGSAGVMQQFFPTTQTETQTFLNSGTNNTSTFNFNARTNINTWNWQQLFPPANGSTDYDFYNDVSTYAQPGINVSGLWTAMHVHESTTNCLTRGICQHDGMLFNCYKFGDCAAHATYGQFRCGANAANDQGCQLYYDQFTEMPAPYGSAVSSSTTSNGGTAVVGNWTNGDNFGDVSYLVLTGTVLASGNVTSATARSGNTLTVQTTSDTHAISSGYATLTNDCGAYALRNSPNQTACAISNLRGSFSASAGQTVCVGDPSNPEQSTITAASGGSLTLGLTYFHPAGVHLFQGGMCGGKQNFDVQNIATHVFSTLWVAGSNAANTMETMFLNKANENTTGPSNTGAYHVYLGAEIVQPPSGNTVTVEPNNGTWTGGAHIENPNFYTQQIVAHGVSLYAFTPPTVYQNVWTSVGMGGVGFGDGAYLGVISTDVASDVYGLTSSGTIPPHLFFNSATTGNNDHLFGFADITPPIPTFVEPYGAANGFITRVELPVGTEISNTWSWLQVINVNAPLDNSFVEYNYNTAGMTWRGFNDLNFTSASTIELVTDTAAHLLGNGSEICTVALLATDCSGAGGGGLSGQTTGYLPQATSATTSTTSSKLQDTGSTLVYHGTGTAHGISFPASSTPITPASGVGIFTTDASGNTEVSENGAAAARLCSATNGVCGASGAVLYNLSTSNYYILGDSTAGVTSSCIESALPSDTVTITAGSISGSTLTATATNTWSTGCVLTLSGFGGGYTGLNGQIVAVSATGLSGSAFQVPVVGSFTAGSTGAGAAQVTYNLTGQLAKEPFFAGHGTVTNGATSNYTIANAVSNYSTTAHPFSPTVTGHPGFLIIHGLGIQDLLNGVSLGTMQSGMQSLWAAARADGWTGIVQVTLPGYVPTGLSPAPASQWTAFNTWLRAQGPTNTTVSAGQYWDKIIYLDTILPNALDTTYFISGSPQHLTDNGNQVVADLFNQAFGVQGAQVNPYAAVVSIANVTITLTTSAISGGTCEATAHTQSMPGLTTASAFDTAFATDPSGVTGWGPVTPGLVFNPWPTSNTLNWKVCNNSGASITPGAMNLNVGAK